MEKGFSPSVEEFLTARCT